MRNVLIVDDEQTLIDVVESLVKREFAPVNVMSCFDAESAVELIRSNDIYLLITDLFLPGMSGQELLRLVKRESPRTVVIVITAFSSIAGALEAMRMGAFTYIPKPFKNEEMIIWVERALDFGRSQIDRDTLAERLILADWDALQRATSPAEKGRSLENLCSALFVTISGWAQLESRVRLASEEIDIVIFNESVDKFWERFGSLILVECKNWSHRRRPGRKEFDQFYLKIKRRSGRDCRLGFFVTAHGVTKTFLAELGRISQEETLIVPLTLKDLWNLIRADDRSALLKKHVAGGILA